MKLRSLLSVGCVLLMVAGLFALGIQVAPWQRALLADRWQDRLPAVADEDVETWLRQIGALGDEGIGVLVTELGSHRRAVSTAAARVLHESVNEWERLPALEAGRKLDRLAQELAEHHGQFYQSAQQVSADLALRVLTWPTPGSLSGRSRTISACQAVLTGPADATATVRADKGREAKPAGGKAPTAALTMVGPPRANSQRSPSLKAVTAVEADAEIVEFVDDDQDMAPMDFDDGDPIVEVTDEAEAMAPTALASDRSDDVPPVDEAAPGELPEDASGDRGDGAEAEPDEPFDPFPVQKTALVSDAEPPAPISEPRLSELDLIQVFSQLNSADPNQVSRARGELAARGCTERLMELGQHLTAPDAAERRRWAEALPGMRGAQAKAWLLFLSRDNDAGVRQTTVGLMATSSDPEMLERVRQMAQDDADPHVRRQASRLADSQRRATRR